MVEQALGQATQDRDGLLQTARAAIASRDAAVESETRVTAVQRGMEVQMAHMAAVRRHMGLGAALTGGSPGRLYFE